MRPTISISFGIRCPVTPGNPTGFEGYWDGNFPCAPSVGDKVAWGDEEAITIEEVRWLFSVEHQEWHIQATGTITEEQA